MYFFCLTYKYSKTSHSIHQKVFTNDNVSSHDRLQRVDFDHGWVPVSAFKAPFTASESQIFL